VPGQLVPAGAQMAAALAGHLELAHRAGRRGQLLINPRRHRVI
jgi:hypothetical protein